MIQMSERKFKFATRCSLCGAPIEKGEVGRYSVPTGPVHTSCAEEARERAEELVRDAAEELISLSGRDDIPVETVAALLAQEALRSGIQNWASAVGAVKFSLKQFVGAR